MSDLKDFNLAIADKFQLKYYAKESLGLTLTMAMGEDTMREKIADHCTKNNIDPPAAKIVAKGVKADEYVTIHIAKAVGKDGAMPVFLGSQGVGYWVPRGINVKVPPTAVECLKNAVQDIVTQDPDTGAILHEDVLTYNYQIIHDPNLEREQQVA